MDTLSNPFIWLIVYTIFYIVAQYYMSDYRLILDGVYFSCVIMTMYIVNMNMIQSNCGSPGSNGLVLKVTFLPWILMFVPMVILLYLFPIWKQPFSNTFGYMVTYLAIGAGPLIQLLQPKETEGMTALHNVYDSPFVLINQFTVQNFPTAFHELKDIFNPDIQALMAEPNWMQQPSIQPFYKMILLKDIISQGLWYLLAGSVVVTKSFQMITSAGCTRTAEQQASAEQTA